MAARSDAQNAQNLFSGVPGWPFRRPPSGRRAIALPAAATGLAIAALLSVWAWRWFMPATTISPASTSQADQMAKSLTRLGTRPEGTFPSVDVLLITPDFVRLSSNPELVGAIDSPALIFYVYEQTHEGALVDPPRPLLRVAGSGIDSTWVPPTEVRVVSDSMHHRSVMLRYALAGPLAQLQQGNGDRLELVFPAPAGVTPTGNLLTWDLPIRYTRDSRPATPIISPESLAAPFSGPGVALKLAMALGLLGALSVLSAPWWWPRWRRYCLS